MKTLTQKSTAAGIYLYAVMAADKVLERTASLQGIDEQWLYAISQRNIAVVVSDIMQNKIRPERRHLAAHHAVLKQLLESDTILPVRFGVIAKNPAAVRKLLIRHYAVLNQQLQKLAGKIEMGVTITWDIPNIFEYFVKRYPELMQARTQMLSQPLNSREAQIETGELFAKLLNNEREQHAEILESLLAPVCDDIARNPPHRVEEVLNLACLVPREKKARFEEAIQEAAKEWDDNFLIKYTGPWPPHNFTQLNLEI